MKDEGRLSRNFERRNEFVSEIFIVKGVNKNKQYFENFSFENL